MNQIFDFEFDDALCYIFFFQAEDGIRDKLVTGVQTCALPISPQPGSCRTGWTSWPVGDGMSDLGIFGREPGETGDVDVDELKAALAARPDPDLPTVPANREPTPEQRARSARRRHR